METLGETRLELAERGRSAGTGSGALRLPRLLAGAEMALAWAPVHRPAGAAAGSPLPAHRPLIPHRCRPSPSALAARILGAPGSYRRWNGPEVWDAAEVKKWSPCARASQGCQGERPSHGPLPGYPLPPGRLPELPAVRPCRGPAGFPRQGGRGRKDSAGRSGPRRPAAAEGRRPAVGGRRAAPNWRLRSRGPGVNAGSWTMLSHGPGAGVGAHRGRPRCAGAVRAPTGRAASIPYNSRGRPSKLPRGLPGLYRGVNVLTRVCVCACVSRGVCSRVFVSARVCVGVPTRAC